MDSLQGAPDSILPNRKKFAEDPFGYSLLAWHKWGWLRELSGFPVDIASFPNREELKSPVLWLAHAKAMSEAAEVVFRSEPAFDGIPNDLKGVCDSQYCAIGLMLVGYSLEICLKGMLIIQKGVAAYSQDEKTLFHHRLDDLADFVPDLSEKDKVILKTLTHFVTWAGRYPDPGPRGPDSMAEVFQQSEKFRISGRDLFQLAARIMAHAKTVIG